MCPTKLEALQPPTAGDHAATRDSGVPLHRCLHVQAMQMLPDFPGFGILVGDVTGLIYSMGVVGMPGF